MRQCERGFSFAELLAVVTILGVVAAVAIPDLSTSDPTRLDLAADEIAQAMRYARSEAIRSGEPHGFRLKSNVKRIRVFRPDISTSPWTLKYDVYHPVSKQLYDIELDTHPFARADNLSHNRVYRGTCDTKANVYFDRSGIPRCADPETVLLQQFDVTLTLGSHTRVVSLHGLSGRVTVQ